jgi:hypothetical protein
MLVVYAQHNKFVLDNLQHTGEESDKFYMQRKKRMDTVPFDQRLDYVRTHRTKRFHYKS